MKNKTTQGLGNKKVSSVISKALLTQILKTKKQCQQTIQYVKQYQSHVLSWSFPDLSRASGQIRTVKLRSWTGIYLWIDIWGWKNYFLNGWISKICSEEKHFSSVQTPPPPHPAINNDWCFILRPELTSSIFHLTV
jgi:hypothetical protein